MRNGITITLGEADRRRLDALVEVRNTPQKHVWRAWIVLMSADGAGTHAIMAQTGTAKTTVWRWQARFMADGVEGLPRDKTRPPGRPPVAQDNASAAVALTLKPPPHEATHWTARAMAKVDGQGRRTGGLHGAEDLEGPRPAPHRWHQFKPANDPAVAEGADEVDADAQFGRCRRLFGKSAAEGLRGIWGDPAGENVGAMPRIGPSFRRTGRRKGPTSIDPQSCPSDFSNSL